MTELPVFTNYIGGQWVESVSGQTYTISNPAHKGQILGEFQRSVAEDAIKAIESAREALPAWSSMPAPKRAAILYRAVLLMEERGELLARSITTEEGKPLPDAQGEVKRSMNITEYAAGEGRRLFGYTTPSELPNTVAYTTRRPLGVVGIITPWNFPLAIPAWKIAPALICGNTLVFKPASAAPMTAVELVKIFEDAGLPPGVLNLITGPGASVGNTIVEHPDVAGVSFTGSTETGTALYTKATAMLKKV
ncbi:MAG: aldehyde dehydrogenase family protein, partial [Chloroflexi bacterium]|nr:aldehyde dehydrogenase family protein [Chloroflexota bacterium]